MYRAPFQVRVRSGSRRANCLASLSHCNCVILILRHGSRKVDTPAARKTLTAVKAATPSHSNYSFTTAGYIHYQTLWVHIWRIAVLSPPCTTNPRSTTVILFYLSSRRQPTSALSPFLLYNHLPSSSGTPTHAVHLRVLPLPHLQRRGRGGLRFKL